MCWYKYKQKQANKSGLLVSKIQFGQSWASYITSPGVQEKLLWPSSRPSRWHPQHMWHDLLQHWCTRAQSHCANSRQGPQMWVAPLGQGSRMRCPSLCVALQMLLTTARLSASLGLDQIHTEECSLRLSPQPPCNAGTHTYTCRQSHTWNHF